MNAPSSLTYWLGNWREGRGDLYDHWGQSTYWFEVAGDDVLQHLEVYAGGPALHYDVDHHEDAYGTLAQALPTDQLHRVTRDDFTEALSSSPPANRLTMPLMRWGRISSPPTDRGSFVRLEVEDPRGWKVPPPSDAVRLIIADPMRPDDADRNHSCWLHASGVDAHLDLLGVIVEEWLPPGTAPPGDGMS